MIDTLILTFFIMVLVVLGMAVGAIFNGRSIKGSCGGIGNVPGIEPIPCNCEKPCDKKKARMASAAAAEVKTIHFDLHKKV